jgi:hypothetical protein
LQIDFANVVPALLMRRGSIIARRHKLLSHQEKKRFNIRFCFVFPVKICLGYTFFPLGCGTHNSAAQPEILMSLCQHIRDWKYGMGWS